MKRWNSEKSKYIENTKIDEFLKDIVAVCERHGLAISHEDHQGSFGIVDLARGDVNWLLCANDYT